MSEEEEVGEVRQLVTHDFVLDIYEQSLDEDDDEKRDAIIATAKVLSENIGTYLVDFNI